jgi:DNA-binding HxlR family transcriptional regulator
MSEQEIIQFLYDAGCIVISSIKPGDPSGECTYRLTERGRQLRDALNHMYGEKARDQAS